LVPRELALCALPQLAPSDSERALAAGRLNNGRMSGALVIIGAPGAGKSSVLEALGTLLELDGVAYGAIESEQLSRGSPLLVADDWIPQLAAIMALQRRAGRTLFLIAATTETAGELAGAVGALDVDRAIVVCLSASAEVVAARVEAREPDTWPGKQRLIAHAGVLARSIPTIDGIDLIINTDAREAQDVAREIREVIGPLLA
jgi:chloramphenicol 3-O-phosphotransferase